MNKGNHFIAESYQRNFVDANGRIWVLDPDGKIYSANPEKTFKKAYFNVVKLPDGGGSLAVENALCDIEGSFATTVKKLNTGQSLIYGDKINIAQFVATMFSRTKRQRDHMRSQLERVIAHGEAMESAIKANSNKRYPVIPPDDRSDSVSLTELKDGMKDFDSEHAATILTSTIDIAPILEKMHYIILEAPEGKVFVSSDGPLCLCSPGRELEYGSRAVGARAGIEDADVEVTFPISSRYAIFMTWQIQEDIQIVATPRQVDQINYRTMRAAGNILANNREFLEGVLQINQEAMQEDMKS
jgi:hypothetical protein